MISKIVFVLAFEKNWKQSFLWHGRISLSLFKRMWPIDNHDCYVASGEVLGRSRRPSKASSVFMKRPSNGPLLLIYVRKINALSLRLPCKRIKKSCTSRLSRRGYCYYHFRSFGFYRSIADIITKSWRSTDSRHLSLDKSSNLWVIHPNPSVLLYGWLLINSVSFQRP